MTVPEIIHKYRHLADLHITRSMCQFIVVSKGKVIEVVPGKKLKYCPLHAMIARPELKEYTEEKMAKFGHFCVERELVRQDYGVPYGTSEMAMTALRKGLLDCAITVCDGAGSVVAMAPEIVQGIGARMNGLFYTTPIAATQARLRAHGCLVFDDARIDQARALRAAIAAGHRRILVTVNVCYGDDFAQLRRIERDGGATVTLAGLCSTDAAPERARSAVDHCDLAWACASRYLREYSTAARLQITQGIPIFVYTPRGVDFVAAYSDAAGAAALGALDPAKQYLLATEPGQPRVRMGLADLAIKETRLPVCGHNQPRPLV